MEYLQSLDLAQAAAVGLDSGPLRYLPTLPPVLIAQQFNVAVVIVMKRLVIGYHQPEWHHSTTPPNIPCGIHLPENVTTDR